MVVVAALIAAPTDHASAKQHLTAAPYKSPVAGFYAGAGATRIGVFYYDCRSGLGCAVLDVGVRDRFVRLEVKDQTGMPLHARVQIPYVGEIASFCGSTPQPLTVADYSELLIKTIPGTCPDGTRSSPAAGQVVGEFT